MIFRNSILSIFRSKGKTILFTLLIFSLTLTLALGVSVWSSIEQFLDDCADYFTTIALVEYMGTGYPDDTANDPFMLPAIESFDTTLITADDSTMRWEESVRGTRLHRWILAHGRIYASTDEVCTGHRHHQVR